MNRFLLVLALAFGLLGSAVPARAEGDPDVFARVVVAETELRAGPGVSYRVIHRAHRGDTFLIRTRETSGYWLEVLLPDGRSAFALGDTVEAMAVDSDTPDAPSKPGLFAPPALEDAHAGLALMGGVWNGSGYSELRPALVIAPAIAFEPYVGLSLQTDSRRLIYGGAFALNLAPDWALAPFVVLGAGGMHETPKEENIREQRSWFHARVGGGLLVSLRFRLLLRLEASDFVLFTEDRYKNVQSYVGGLGSYF
ncbi:MAG TPA: SH3 domain-containing protein [Polyangiaceae bacterium]|nr:SH3 domain-containing protein [Polyangiaceae bacterium]